MFRYGKFAAEPMLWKRDDGGRICEGKQDSIVSCSSRGDSVISSRGNAKGKRSQLTPAIVQVPKTWFPIHIPSFISMKAIRPILTFQEYRSTEHRYPYSYSIQFSGSSLYYFGLDHIFDSDHPHLLILEQQVRSWKPDAIVLQGFPLTKFTSHEEKTRFLEKSKSMTRASAIKTDGESGLALLLANESGAVPISAEPSRREEVSYLRKLGFPEDALLAHYCHRLVPQWMKQSPEIPLEKYMEGFFPGLTEYWPSSLCSYEHMRKLSYQFWGQDIVLDDFRKACERTSPEYFGGSDTPQTVVNEIFRESIYWRDIYIITVILDALAEHRRVLVVYGAQHAVAQEGTLRDLLELSNGDIEIARTLWKDHTQARYRTTTTSLEKDRA